MRRFSADVFFVVVLGIHKREAAMILPNQTLETNRRHAIPLDAGWAFGCAVYASSCLSGGGRSAHL